MNFTEPIKILLIDVNSGYLRSLEPKLQSAGVRTFIAQDYQQILSEARLGRFDLIIIGETLIDVDNFDLPHILKYVNSTGCYLPIIWIPPKTDPQLMLAGLELQIDLVLDRETPLPILLSYILSLANKKRQSDELLDTICYLRDLLAQQSQQMDDLKTNNSKLHELSMTDPLTGLFNARYMYRWLTQAFAYATRYEKPLSVIFLDMDHFKWINDCYGHLAGDKALKVLANVLKNSVRDSDLVARYAGDEFLITLPETPADQLSVLAERILSELKNTPITSGGEQFYMSCSMGAATYPDRHPIATSQDLLNLADQALYAAKRAGRGQLAQWHRLGKPHQEAVTANTTPVLES